MDTHRLAAAAWSGVLGVVFVAVAASWLVLWPLTLPVEFGFRFYLRRRVRALSARKAHVPASLRARMTPAERTASFARVLDAVAAAHAGDAVPSDGLPRFLSLWHRGAPFASLRRSHLLRFLSAHFLFSELETLSGDQRAELEAILSGLEQAMGLSFPDGDQNGDKQAEAEKALATAMRVSMPQEPLVWMPYPLVLYAAFAGMDLVARLVLRLFGFQHRHTADGTLSYWHRPAQTPGGVAPPPPVVLLPGIGIGPAGYVPMLLRCLCADGAAAFLVELPHVAAGRLHGGVPDEEAAAAALLAMLAAHGERSARWVAHSYGTFVLAWLLRHPAPGARAAVRSAVLLDPAAVLIAFPHVLHGAVFRRPFELPLAVQARPAAAASPAPASRLRRARTAARLAMAYAVTKEAHIALAVQRHTFWPSASLWLDDFQDGCHVTVALSEGDVLLPTREVAAYTAAVAARSAEHGVTVDLMLMPRHAHGEITLNPTHWGALCRALALGAARDGGAKGKGSGRARGTTNANAGPPHGE